MTTTATESDPVVEAERFVLGTAITEIDHTPGADDLQPAEFLQRRHEVIWRAIQAARASGDPVDLVAVGERLRAAGDLARVGGMPYLSDLVSSAMGPGTLQHHARIIHAAARRRARLQHAERLHRVAGDDDQWDRYAAELLGALGGTAVQETPEPGHLAQLRGALVDTGGLDSIPDPEPLIGDDILFRDCLAWMVGKPGCMKSFTALDMAGCVATGQTWQGWRVNGGPVLYLVAEGVRGIKKRVRAWEASMGQPMTGVQFLPVAVQSKNRTQWDALVDLAAELQPALIVIDTQARVTVGVEENSNAEMGEFVHQAEKLRAASSAAVLIVHHIGRNGDTGRGATTLDGALSTVIKVTKDDDRVKLECQKNKDGAEWDDINLRAVPTGDSLVLMLDDGDRPAKANSAAARKWVRDWWSIFEADPMTPAKLMATLGVAESTFYRTAKDLIDAGAAAKEGRGNATRYKLLHAPAPT